MDKQYRLLSELLNIFHFQFSLRLGFLHWGFFFFASISGRGYSSHSNVFVLYILINGFFIFSLKTVTKFIIAILKSLPCFSCTTDLRVSVGLLKTHWPCWFLLCFLCWYKNVWVCDDCNSKYWTLTLLGNVPVFVVVSGS